MRGIVLAGCGVVVLIVGALALALVTSSGGSPPARVGVQIAATPARSGTPSVAGAPTAAVPPSFMFTPSAFLGHVVHFSYRYYYNHGPNDPINGVQDTVDDVWLRFGSDGHVDLVHTISRGTDGTVMSEQLLTPTGGTRLNGPGSVPGLPASAPCRNDVTTLTANSLDAMGPKFYDLAQFSAIQGTPTATHVHPTQQFTEVAQLPGATPVQVYPSPTMVTEWVSRGRPVDGMTDTSTIEVGPDGRVVYIDGRTFDASGKLIGELTFSYGPVEVYNAGDVPPSALTLSSDVCGG